jgi:multidrug efflux pump subunit AcrB
MIAIVRIALQRPYTFVVMAMLILIFGVMALVKTPTDVFPDIGIPVVSVVWSYNGLPPGDMSGRVIYYYERTLSSQVNDIQHIESQSLPGYGVVKIFFQPTVNINTALAQITAASQTVLKLLPPGITPPYVLTFNASTVPVLQLALSSDSLSQSALFDYAQNFIRPQLATVAGAAVPSPYGGKVRQVQVDIDQHKLSNYGLSAQDIVNALAAQNLIIPMGTQKIGTFEYVIKLNDAPTKIDSLNDLPVKSIGNSIVYIRDVAFVHEGAPPQQNAVRVDGSHAVLMTILKSGSASTLDVINGVKALLPKIKASMPDGMKIDAISDQSAFVKSSVDGVLREGAIAAGLTGLMILLFLGSWRSTLIILISIPLAILGSVAALAATGETINVMTLGGLALAVGILVDDATVTIENINWHLEQGKAIDAAILDGAAQIVVPATVSLLCICIVFVPMFSLGGVSGFLFRPLAKAVVFALIFSYILSRTLVNTLARYLLTAHAVQQEEDLLAQTLGEHAPPNHMRATRNPLVNFQRGFEHRFEKLRTNYRGILQMALGLRWKFVSGFLVVVFLSFGLVPFLGKDFFAPIESNQIKLHIRAQTGTRIEKTADLCDQIENVIRGVIPPKILDSIVDNIGLPISGINIAYANSGSVGAADADVLISLKSGSDSLSDGYIETLREQLPKFFPGTVFAFLPADIITQILNFGSPAPIDVQVIGHDADENKVYAQKILKDIAKVPGVADARIQQAFNVPTLKIDVDRSLAKNVGLTEKDVATSLQDSLAGSIQSAPAFWLNPMNGVSYPIVVQSPQYWVDSLNALKTIPITAPNVSQLIGGITTIHRGMSNAVVSHYNVQPVVDIYAATHDRDLGNVTSNIQTIIDQAKKEAPPGSTVVLRGQAETMNSAYTQLFTGLGLAILLIYLLIVVNFQSWLDPGVIVAALPAALVGIVWMLFTTGTTLSVPALTGAIMCMGVATANSILVISFARERLTQGLDPIAAALDAGFSRFRPVCMTALAMIIGMLPMALSSEQNAPLGRAVIGGLLCSTLATLVFVPVLFALAHSYRSEKANAAKAGPLAAPQFQS